MADNAHSLSAVTLGRIMSCYADGGRVLELRLVVRKNKKWKNEKREVKNMKAGHPQMGHSQLPPCLWRPKNLIFTKEELLFFQRELRDDFFRFWRLLVRLKKRKKEKDEKKRKNGKTQEKNKIRETEEKTKRKERKIKTIRKIEQKEKQHGKMKQ